MKNFIKWFVFITFVVIIGFSMVGCDLNNDDYEKFNGDWDRVGQYVVSFNDGKGTFKELYGDIWLDGKNTGQINIDEQCYRNLSKSSDNNWTGEIRIYNTYSPHETLRWENCTLQFCNIEVFLRKTPAKAWKQRRPAANSKSV